MSPTVERNLHDLEDNVNMLLRRVERKRSISSLQQEQLPPHDVQSVQQLQPQLQNPEVKSNGNQTNPHLQSTSSDGSATEKEKKANNIIRASTVSSQGPNLQKDMMNSQQPGNNLNAERGNIVCLFPGNTSQSYTSSSRGVGTVPQRTINNLEMSSNMSLLQQNEQQMIKSQLPKRKSQQHQMTKQSVQQTEAHQIPQLHLNEVNNMKVRQGISFKEGSLLQHHSTGKLSVRNPHVLRSGPPSPQLIQASSPQVPQFDQKILHMSLPNSGSRLHSPNSRSVWPSPSTSIGPFHIKGDPSKLTSAVSSVTNPGDVKLKETSSKLPLHSSYVISTPGLSPSCLLGESDGPDGNQNQVSTPDFCESRVIEEPILRLVKAVRSLSYKSLNTSISDMESVVRLVDSAAESKPGNGSLSAIGENFGGVANLILQGEKIDRNARKTKMRRCIGAVQLNICASSCETDSLKKLTDPKKFAEPTATSHNKKLRSEVKCILSHEIREINQRLIDTVVDINEEVDSTCGIPETEGSHGTIVRCSFNAVTVNPDMTSIHVSAVMPLLSPLLLLVPRNYPDCSPVLLDKLPAEVSSGYEDLSGKAMSKLSAIMRNLLQPMSVGDIAKSWDFCAREVITEYAQLNGGGNFSSTYGTWENHLSTA
ncbi:hypothetical protein Vadar_033506 [Vaccinium darrowii]|uniref:Uncharacterized protein n=1 Tax=Vaccinium darrowii TaxID=229202 RepID=A0ACB7ZG81_9ERIC|nr:hypothetical protein Vadar_033506 [Vaccinium darrowii]